MKKSKVAISYVLAVLLLISAAISVMMTTSAAEINRLPHMCEKIVDDDYVEKMSIAVTARLRTTLALSALTPEDITDVFDTETVRREAVSALGCTISAAYGSDDSVYTFDSEALRERIEEKLRAYADEHGIAYDEAGAAETYTAVCTAVSTEFSVLSAKYTAKIAPIAAKLLRVLNLFYIPIIATVVLAAAIVVTCRKKMLRAALTVLHPLYFAAFIPCVLFALLKHRDYLSSTVITEGTLSTLVHRAYLLICGDMSLMMLVITIILAVALVSTIIVMAAVTTKKSAKEA